MGTAAVVTTSEICLKGGNRRMFEDRLLANIRAALGPSGGFRASRSQGSFRLLWPSGLADSEREAVRRGLSRTFGIAKFAFVSECAADPERIAETALPLLPPGAKSFKVDVRRNDKSHPLQSPEVARLVGGKVLEARPDLAVRMRDPETVVQARIVSGGRAQVSVDPESGPGGLPLGSSGTLVSLLSGGIDSPAAAWKMMGRGCRSVFVHCHSYPYVGRESVDKIRRLAAVLDGWQGGSRLYLIPFADVQREIVAKCSEANRVVLYRRMMLRLAEAVAEREGALGIVTGDSVGQVASQTVENIRAVSAAVALPIYRPLCGDDKEAIVRLARRIGTYGLSIEPHDDCCSLFTPDHPNTRANPDGLAADEAKIDFVPLLQKAIDGSEVAELPSGRTAVL